MSPLFRMMVLLALGVALPAVSAQAQPIGSFRWQLQPYCNVITVNVTQQGAIYTLDGTDDRCGGGNQPASAIGIAYLTPLGLVGFGITSVLPNGTPVHTEATISIASLNGTWRDSGGNNGTFIFTPGAPVAGTPRPIPSGGIAPASITNIQIAPAAIDTTHIVNGSITTADLAAPPRSASVDSTGSAVTLTTTPATVRSITITAPAAGRVIVNAQGLFEGSAASVDYAACGLFAQGQTFDSIFATFYREEVAASMDYVPLAATRGFPVSAGANTFNLLCRTFAGNALVWYVNLTAIYTP